MFVLKWNGANMLPRRPAKKKSGIKKKKKKSLLREPASHSPVMRHFCSQRGERCRSSYKKEIRGSGMFRFNEQTFRPGICAAASLVWHDEQGLSSIGSSPDPGSSCQSMHKSSPPPLPSFYSSWAHATSRYTTLYSKQMQTLSHMPVYLRDINKIKRTFVWARNNYTHMRALLQSTLWCHCRERVYCGTHSRHSSLTAIKK